MLAYTVKQSPLPSIGRITCLGYRRGRAAGVAGGCMRGGSGRAGPLQSARGRRSPRIGPSSLDRPKASEWPRGGPGRPSRPSHPLPALWIGPGRRHGLASPFNGSRGTHLAQAKGPLRPAPPASALPAPPTGTGQSTRRLRQRGGACVRGRFLAEDGIYANIPNMQNKQQNTKYAMNIPNMQKHTI